MASGVLARHSLTNRIATSTLLICLLGLWSLLFYADRVLREDMQRMLGEQQFSTASILAENINTDLQLRFSVLENLAGKITPALLAKPTALQAFLDEQTSLTELFNLGAIVVAPDGNTLADLPRSRGRIGVNYLHVDAIASALKEGQSGVGRPALGKTAKAPVFSMVVPIRNKQREVVAALAGGINLEKPSFLDKLASGRYGKTGGYLLVSVAHRVIVTASDPKRIMVPVAAPGTSPLIDRFIAGYEGSGVFINPLGIEVLASAKGIPQGGWYLVVSLPTAEAFAPLKHMQGHMFLAALALSLLAAGMTWWIVRHQLAPLVDAANSLADLSEENLPEKPLSIVRADESGLLIGSFNQLLESLKQREASLRESENRLRLTLDSASLGYWELDLATMRSRRSRRHAEIFGQTEPLPEWSFAAFLDHIHPEDRQEVSTAIREHMNAGKNFQIEFRIVRDDKVVRWVWISSHIFRNVQGQAEHVYGVIADITKQKSAEYALQQSEQYKQSILDSVSQEVVVVGQDGVITSVNEAWRRFAMENMGESGLSASGTEPGANYLDVCRACDDQADPDAIKAYEGVRNVLDGVLHSFTLEYACHSPEQQRWFEMTVTPLHFDQRSVVITHSDITSRKALRGVLESKTLLQSVIDSTPDWIHVRDREHRFLLVNQSFAQAFNSSPIAMFGQPDADFISKEICQGDPDRRLRGLHPDDEAVFAGQTIHDPCDKFILDSGEVRYFDTFKGPLRDASQQIFGVLTYRRDITDRFVTEQEQRTLENQLRQAQKMELIGHLTGGIAHDFNNILAAILGYAELANMEQDVQRIPRLSGYLEEILQAGIRAKELIAQLLTSSQRRETVNEAISVSPIVREVAKLLRATLPSSITIDAEVADDLPAVLISPVQLHQIMMNLGVNARDAVSNNGFIKLTAERLVLDELHTCESCHHSFTGRYLMISVQDSGEGITQENLGRIFDPFFTTKPVGKGSGLGLSVLHGIVHSARGHISVLTAPGAGTEFRIYLPTQRKQPSAKEPVASSSINQRAMRGRIMVVDDEASIVGFMTGLLENLGCEVIALTNAEDALNRFLSDPHGVDLVITDQTMPGLNGTRLASAMLASRPDIPIIIITGNNYPISSETARAIGIRRILSKPVPVRVLADIVGEYLDISAR